MKGEVFLSITMKSRRMNRRAFRRDRKGVSEIIGNLLVLGITVSLFSAVIYWIGTMPAPPTRGKVNLSASLNLLPAGGGYVNITHQGGQSLRAGSTVVQLLINASFVRLGLADGGLPGDWKVGGMWSWFNSSIYSSSTVTLWVINNLTNSVVLQVNLLGGKGSFPPFITDVTTSPSPIAAGDTMRFRVRVTDINGDLNASSVYANLANLGLGSVQMSDPDGDGTFESPALTAAAGWDGIVVAFNASDMTGAVDARQYTVSISRTIVGPAGPPGPAGGNATFNGSLPYNYTDMDSGGTSGYDIFNASGLATRSGTRVFSAGETVYVHVASIVLWNLRMENSLILYNTSFLKVEPQTKEYEPLDPAYAAGGPLDEPAFYNITTSEKFYVFEYNFTAPATPGQYPLFVSLKDSSGHSFLTFDTIYVSYPDGSVPLFPQLMTLADPNKDGVLTDEVASDEFNATDIMYVKIVTNDTDPTLASVDMGDVEVKDFYGHQQIKRKLPRPPTSGNAPLSAMYYDSNYPLWAGRSGGNRTYQFGIDLIERNQDSWLRGKNTYIVYIRFFNDTNEEYVLAKLVKIRAPLSTADIVSTVWLNRNGRESAVYWYSNGEYWYRTVVQPRMVRAANALALGDINGDGRTDIVVGTEERDTVNLAWFENMNPYGTEWRVHFVNTAFGPQRLQYLVESVAVTDLDSDGDGDIVAGMSDTTGDTGTGLHVFVNDGSWSDVMITPMGAGVVVPSAKTAAAPGPLDNTGETLANITGDDNLFYNVSSLNGGRTMAMTTWNWQGTPIDQVQYPSLTGATLNLQYRSDSNFSTDQSVWWQQSGGGGYYQTGIQPVNSQVEALGVFDVFGAWRTAFGADPSFNDIMGLDVFYQNRNATNTVTYKPSAKQSGGSCSDNTGDNVNDNRDADGVYYMVDNGDRLHMTTWDTAGAITQPITSVTLKVGYYTQNGYNGNDWIQWDFNGGSAWKNAIRVYNTNEANTVRAYDLFAQGVDTAADVAGLEVCFDSSDNDWVQFDYMWIEIGTGGTESNLSIERMWIEMTAMPAGGLGRIVRIATGNFDGDAGTDIAAIDRNGLIGVFYNDGDHDIYPGGWLSPIRYLNVPNVGGGNPYYYIRTGNMTGSGDASTDIIASNNNDIWVFPNPGTGAFVQAAAIRIDTTPANKIDKPISAINVGDFNGDGRLDILAGTQVTSASDRPQLWEIRQPAAGWVSGNVPDSSFMRIDTSTMGNELQFRWDANRPLRIQDIAVGDLDGDGDPDLAYGITLGRRGRGEVAHNLWAHRTNTATPVMADPDGIGPTGSVSTLRYIEEEVYIDPWDRTNRDISVVNVEIGYIDL